MRTEFKVCPMIIIGIWIIAVVLFLLLLLLLSYYIINLIASISGAPYIATSEARLNTVANLLPNSQSAKVVELGAGEAKTLVRLASMGYEVEGYEINPFLVLKGRLRIWNSGLKGIRLHWRDYWGVDLSRFDCVYVYGITYVMKRLQDKFQRELKPGTLVISIGFHLPGTNSIKEENGVYVYRY